MYIIYSSDALASAKQCLEKNTFMENNNILLYDRTGVISIPEQGKNLFCTWKIAVSPDSRLKITFKPFESDNDRRCSNGYMEIRDGVGYDTPTQPLSCNGSTIAPWYSNGSHIWIRTRYDKYDSAWNGFKLCYETVDKGEASCSRKASIYITWK